MKTARRVTKFSRYNRSEKGRERNRRFDAGDKRRVLRERYNELRRERIVQKAQAFLGPEITAQINAYADRMVARWAAARGGEHDGG